MNIEPIAKIETDFPTKFGIPRQSGIVAELSGRIVFEDKYRSAEAIRGLEDFSHLWVIWGFSENEGAKYNATVRPPRLGGNERVGVFASRSPFRPNSLGLSLVRLEKIENAKFSKSLFLKTFFRISNFFKFSRFFSSLKR